MKRPAARPLAEFLDACLQPALAAQGFASADIVVAWPELVGPKLAAYCEPVRIAWPRGRKGAGVEEREPAVLHVRVEGAFALELQHMAPVLIERVNAYYGWRCIGRLSLRQGPVGRDRAERPSPLAPDPAALAQARADVGSFADAELGEALARLGAAIRSARTRP